MSTASTAGTEKQYIAWTPLLFMLFVHIGALLAFVPQFFTWQALAVCLFLHWLCGGVGICLTYHRLLTHRSFSLRPRWLEYPLTIIGCTSLEGGPVGWVADHRRHHAYSDEEGDVHSPNQGFGWAHMFWFMTPDITSRHTPEYLNKWAPDLYKDPVHRFLQNWNILCVFGMAGLLYAIGGMPFLVWGGFVRTVLVLHTTWLVNSATHVWGYRSHETRDKSTNLWWVALLTYGEGWHNNHHAFQTSARHGLAWWEIDPTYITVWVMEKLGIAYNVKLPRFQRGGIKSVAPSDVVEKVRAAQAGEVLEPAGEA